MFDKDRLPVDNPFRAEIDDVNEAIRDVRLLLSDEIKVGERLDLHVYGMALCFFQSHLRRALMFLDGGSLAMEAGFGLVTLSCARSLYESAACIHDFSKQICEMMDNDDVVAAARFAHQRTFATRVEAKTMRSADFDYTAVNILKQIDALEKIVPNARRSYDLLSEAVHPNAQGAHAYFQTSQENGLAIFDNSPRNVELYSLFASSAALLSIFKSVYLDLQVSSLGLIERELTAGIQDYENRKTDGNCDDLALN